MKNAIVASTSMFLALSLIGFVRAQSDELVRQSSAPINQQLFHACNITEEEQKCYDQRARCFANGRDDCDEAYDICKTNAYRFCK